MLLVTLHTKEWQRKKVVLRFIFYHFLVVVFFAFLVIRLKRQLSAPHATKRMNSVKHEVLQRSEF